jgi:6-pyruvoyl-tetrahydropterin synthase
MNERIQDLIKQMDKAGLPYGNNAMTITDVDLEYFAKLIIQECAELIDNKVTITAAQTYDEVFVAKFDTKTLCAKLIKEHFGVEE